MGIRAPLIGYIAPAPAAAQRFETYRFFGERIFCPLVRPSGNIDFISAHSMLAAKARNSLLTCVFATWDKPRQVHNEPGEVCLLIAQQGPLD